MPETNPHIVGVLLAAGRGVRFGGNKLLAPWRDDTVIAVATARHLIDALPDSVAVLRPGDEILASLLAAEGLRIVVNPHADDGMGSSLACGVAAATEADGWVIALADMPAIRLETIAAVTQALVAGAPLVAPVYQGQRGHPIGFAHRFRQDLMSLRGDRGGHEILARYGNELRQIDVSDPGVLYDVDRAADLIVDER